MSSFILKILAMSTMLCDHLGDYLFRISTIPEPVSILMRSIGRCAYLCYAFLMAEGYRHLKERPERLKDHIFKLVLLLLVSEIPYDFFENRVLYYPADQSVMFTLLLGLLMLAAYEYFEGKRVMQIFTLFAGAMVSFFIHCNYRFAGVLLMFGFYMYLKHFLDKSFWKRVLVLLTIMLVYIPIYTWARTDFGLPQAFAARFVKDLPWFGVHLLMIFPLALYNGSQGFRAKAFQNVYSWFYPAHLAVLAIVRIFAG